MIQLKEKEVKKFLEQDKEKYIKELINIYQKTDNNIQFIETSEEIKKLLHDIFSAGFNSGVKTAAILLKGACKSLNPEEKIES